MDITQLVSRDGQIFTPFFSSYADRVCIGLTGFAAEGLPCAELICNTAEGESRLYATYPAEPMGTAYHCSFFFDPINLQIYEKAVSFRIVLKGFASVSDFSMDEHTDSAQKPVETVSAVFKDAQGNKWVPVLQADRATQVNVPVIPHNVLFIGNSILLGMSGTYGMCASSPRHDYCYHVQQAILAHSPNCKFSKLYGSMFEHATCRKEFEAWWGVDPNSYTGKPAKDSFTEDLDLILIQLGDNVGIQKLASFLECTPILLERIKALCPRARILWVCGWFNSPLTTPPITRFCEEWKLELVDILPTRSPESQSYSGASYETVDGSVATVKDLWITHPGDLGMERIADRIIATLNL